MNNWEIESIKKPFEDDPHKMVKPVIVPILPNSRKNDNNKPNIKNDEWYDKFGIRYMLKGNTLIIKNATVFETLLEHIIAIPIEVKVLISINSCDEFNLLCSELQKNNTNKKIVINIEPTCHFNKSQYLAFEKLPNNVKVTNLFDINTYEEEVPLNNSFDWWCLWLDNEHFCLVKDRLTLKAKKRILEMHTIAVDFYNSFIYKRSNSSVYEKINFVYEWIRKNISYDNAAIYEDGRLKGGCNFAQDPLETFKKRKGVCAGKARLMKLLLNNRFMKVDCFVATGMYGLLPHEWNEIHFPDGCFYYDATIGRQNQTEANLTRLGYSRINHDDFEQNGVLNQTALQRDLPPRRVRRPDLPPLPPRKKF